ncbi:MAG: extracellular solute-binding protein [Desulfobacterales bacterium]|nr:extracellular solute-binding protein [Desulfobacterales bacterium]
MRKLLYVFMVCVFMVAVVALVAGFSIGAYAKETITYYLWDDPTYKNIVEAFNASQDEVFVDAKIIPAADYDNKLRTLLAGGAEMDAFMTKTAHDIYPMVENRYVEPLDDLIVKYNFDLSAMSAYELAYRIDGKVYNIPFRGAGYYTYYNKKVFEKAGVPTPDTYVEKGEWTWEKFVEVAKQIATGDGKIYGAVMYFWSLNQVSPAIQRGVQFITNEGKIDIDDDSVLYSFKMRKELEQAKAIIPQAELKATKTHYSRAFWEGNVGMLLIGAWFPGQMLSARDGNLLKDYTWNDWALTRFPCNEPEYRTIDVPTFNCVHADSKKKDAAFKFIAWMGGPEGAKVVAQNGFLPAVVTPEVEEAFVSVFPDKASLKYFLEDKVVMPHWLNKYGVGIENMLGPVMEEYLSTDMSDDQLKSLINEKLQEIIEITM